jgi:hypothetical protein
MFQKKVAEKNEIHFMYNTLFYKFRFLRGAHGGVVG